MAKWARVLMMCELSNARMWRFSTSAATRISNSLHEIRSLHLMALPLLKLAFRSAAERPLALILSRQTHTSQWDTIAAMGAVIVVALQRHDGNA
jgi:hypothetical protein